MAKGVRGELFVGGHAFDVGQHRIGINLEDMMELAHVDSALTALVAVTKEIRSGFRQSDFRSGRPSGGNFGGQASGPALVFIMQAESLLCCYRTDW